VSFAAAAGLPVAGLTALRALRVVGVLLGRRVLVTGASGGVGAFAVQLAAIGGAEVTGLVSGAHRVSMVESLGAHDVVTSLDRATGPFNAALDGIGGRVLVDAVHRLAREGVCVAYGRASGEASPLSYADFRAAPFASLVGFFVYATDHRTFGSDLGSLAGLLAARRLEVPRQTELNWRDMRAAIDALRARRVVGKVVLTIPEDV
jgi:NADPH:quinone reductase-like Zn-dependent oxidoreductase